MTEAPRPLNFALEARKRGKVIDEQAAIASQTPGAQPHINLVIEGIEGNMQLEARNVLFPLVEQSLQDIGLFQKREEGDLVIEGGEDEFKRFLRESSPEEIDELAKNLIDTLGVGDEEIKADMVLGLLEQWTQIEKDDFSLEEFEVEGCLPDRVVFLRAPQEQKSNGSNVIVREPVNCDKNRPPEYDLSWRVDGKPPANPLSPVSNSVEYENEELMQRVRKLQENANSMRYPDIEKPDVEK